MRRLRLFSACMECAHEVLTQTTDLACGYLVQILWKIIGCYEFVKQAGAGLRCEGRILMYYVSQELYVFILEMLETYEYDAAAQCGSSIGDKKNIVYEKQLLPKRN